MPHYAAFHLGLHCLPKYPFRGFWYTKGLTHLLMYQARLEVLIFGLSVHLHPYFVYASSKALLNLGICAGSHESSLLDNVISTKISCDGPYDHDNSIFQI